MIFNTSLEECVFPSKLKEALIKPIPKKGSSIDVSNHRPISTLNTMAKIFESALYSKMSNFVFQNISTHQHGFVNKKSTMTNLIEFCDYTAKTMSEKKQVDVIYTDAMKCFDCIFHHAIIHKLRAAGVSPSLSKLIENYLRDRKNYVVYENCRSEHFTPPSGVVQGSKLSSLLFILTFDDIKLHIKNSEYKMYADDLKIFRTVSSKTDCELLQQDLNSVQKWLETIGLHLHPTNASKCHTAVRK